MSFEDDHMNSCDDEISFLDIFLAFKTDKTTSEDRS